MDFVQWWTALLAITGMVIGLCSHGKPKKGTEDFRIYFVSLLISLPSYGRIFGWW